MKELPEIKEKDKNGQMKVRFRHDVRLDRELYGRYSEICRANKETPSSRTRKLILDWVISHQSNNQETEEWKSFIEKVKAEGYKTPQEWMKAKLDLEE